MEPIPRIYTADFSGGREIKTHVFQKCWNDLISRNYKWSGRVKKGYKETTAFPSISKKSLENTKSHSNLNSQTSSKPLQELFFSPQISCSQQSLYKAVGSKCAGHHLEHCLARRLKQSVGRQAVLEDESRAALGNTEAFTLRSKEKTADQARSHHANSSALSNGFQQKEKTCLSEEELFFKRHMTAMKRRVNVNIWVLPTLRTDEIPRLKSPKISDDKGDNRAMTDALKSALLETVALAENEHSSQDNGGDRPVYSESSTQSTAQMEPQSASRAEKTKTSTPLLLRSWEVPANLGEDKQRDPPDSDTDRTIIRGHINIPHSAGKKVFMVYICGGYQVSNWKPSPFPPQTLPHPEIPGLSCITSGLIIIIHYLYNAHTFARKSSLGERV
ncbi:uncharacterized protein LOC119855268 isoform X2 [Dermochelys coriacea]|uniref:uncharacterized protein LOC119855268 isoform X2 n=1 Tax=Dermochelys coriacea TaxID=27794 RepID=UPI001CA7D0AF|nr:uncharacterized protein LOC119855268 isoform X2 [Dermochelys coriacea]